MFMNLFELDFYILRVDGRNYECLDYIYTFMFALVFLNFCSNFRWKLDVIDQVVVVETPLAEKKSSSILYRHYSASIYLYGAGFLAPIWEIARK